MRSQQSMRDGMRWGNDGCCHEVGRFIHLHQRFSALLLKTFLKALVSIDFLLFDFNIPKLGSTRKYMTTRATRTRSKNVRSAKISANRHIIHKSGNIAWIEGTQQQFMSGRNECIKDIGGRQIVISVHFTAYIAELNTRLLHTLVSVPLRNFTPSTMRLCVMSWNWILVARDDIHLSVSFN